MPALVRSRAAAVGFAAAAALSLCGPGPAARAVTISVNPLACSVPAPPDEGACTAAREAPVANGPAVPGYTPTQLRGAYGLASAATKAGGGAVIAVVTAYSDPNAVSDLAAYRAHFKLSACPAGRCLRIVNQQGSASPLPAPRSAWALSDATALDAISALCPKCRLLLVQAASNSYADLGTAENTAAASGAKYVLSAWTGAESVGQDSYDHFFNHPGIAVVAPSGGFGGYQRTFPGDLPYVTSVGGTTLLPTTFSSRHWAELAWSKAGSGCSSLEVKPSWQRPDASSATGCPNRTQNDVAADADPATGAAVYDTYQTRVGWAQTGGTVLAAAIVTATYALAGVPAPGSYPASYPYQHSRRLNDVLYGTNGPCKLSPDYLCTAGTGFDGPTGLGTPAGPAAFSAAGTDPVTVLDPGTQVVRAGTSAGIQITGLNSGSGTLTYSAAGLPAGLTITAVPGTPDAQITGTLPASVHAYAVTVTAADPATKRTGTTRFSLVATGSLTPSSPVTNSIRSDFDSPGGTGPDVHCLDPGAQTAGTTVTDQRCDAAAQNDWSFVANPGPASGGTLQIGGLCLALSGTDLDLATCDPGNAAQAWTGTYGGGLANGSTGSCLDAGDFSGPLTLSACDQSKPGQQWWVASTLQSAVPGTCVGTVHQGTKATDVDVELCGQSGVDYDFSYAGSSLRLDGVCVTFDTSGGISTDDVTHSNCQDGLNDSWDPLPDGEILNRGNGLCLAGTGNTARPGNQLRLATCDAALDEIWTIG